MRRNDQPSDLRIALAVCLVSIAGLAWSAPAAAQTVGGRAFGVFVNTPTLGAGPIYLSDSDELSPNGGWEGAGLLSAQVPSILSASVLNAATSGGEYAAGPGANSSSSLADVTLLPGHPAQLTASFVSAEAEATGVGSWGAVEIYDLTVGGVSVGVLGIPNQKVAIPSVGTLIINEQTTGSDGISQSITVNALHLVLSTGEEVILASARSVVNPTGVPVLLARATRNGTCTDTRTRNALWTPGSISGPAVRPVWEVSECVDFVTGGGFFEPPNSNRPARVNFGFNAGPRSPQNPELKGHLNFIEHGPVGPFAPMMHVRGINVDSYVEWGRDTEHCRVFEGDAVVNGMPGFRYKATVCDYGEPGRDDRFMLDLVDAATGGLTFAYNADNRDPSKPAAQGELDGGNIQLHKSKCPKPANLALPERKGHLAA